MKKSYDISICVIFLIWVILSAFSLLNKEIIYVNLLYFLLLVFLFPKSIENTPEQFIKLRLKCIVESITLMLALAIAPTLSSFSREVPVVADAFISVGVGIGIQSVLFLYRLNKTIDKDQEEA